MDQDSKGNTWYTKKMEIVQWTGLKDKHDEDIYFDDIINIEGGIGVVVWMDDRIGIGSGEINNYHAIDSVDMYELAKGEIISSIHSTPKQITNENTTL